MAERKTAIDMEAYQLQRERAARVAWLGNVAHRNPVVAMTIRNYVDGRGGYLELLEDTIKAMDDQWYALLENRLREMEATSGQE